ncbi:MAG: efflux RND transporter periplasmic adaptor subunit [Azonexus sp.]|jgi:RND family efflux transporter MFP subunit|uniref:efflux RND transporter periplasmic adaptor subunit n=1 Tax=Azonexus sp. TaxID=1872668 RepID=UPI0028331906|nr:efflux RND transporter periplasmic adaptor subunit [Azonexus sp.]MDR0775033.1 efflux RND transporter periplasmic adaptor subunit [Azonexus sp.]
MKTFARYAITAAIVIVALLFGKYLWDDNIYAPWTRDGRVKANVINIAADVSGIVTSVPVHDNQFVKQGEVLFTIDKNRYADALAQAEATLTAQNAEKLMRGREAARRANLDSSIVTSESRESADSLASIAAAKYQAAQAARDTARLNLERTEVRAPTDGYVTNLRVFVGDFASAGASRLALIEANSFYVEGYFEETKLPRIAVGDTVELRFLSALPDLKGHVESIARGITDRDAATGRELLADVNPTFNWVRLAQRIPVRVRIDDLPADHRLSAGMTCTVVVKPR